MTTSDLKSGLRLALTKLGKSLHSKGGSPLNLTDDLQTPEERLAARLVQRLGISPPIDVSMIASTFAKVTPKNFPIDIDGLCLDLKAVGKRPKIWISKSLGHVRRRFTLAHEIGHIVIPWHTGSIVDDLEAPRSRSRSQYRQMEAEANRFAAELLMPHEWVVSLSERCEHCADLMHSIVRIADISFPAAYFKAQKYGRAGYVAAEVKDGIIVRSGRTKGTSSLAPIEGTHVESVEMPAAYPPRVIAGDSTDYYWWKMREEVDAPEEVSKWREILETILLSIPSERREVTQARINAIVGYAIGKEPKGSSVKRMYLRGLEATQNRGDRDRLVATVIAHPAFKRYLLARALERSHSAPE